MCGASGICGQFDGHSKQKKNFFVGIGTCYSEKILRKKHTQPFSTQ